MSRKIVIFGTGQIAELAHYYFTKDTSLEVSAFAVDGAYLTNESWLGLPVIDFATVEERFSPGEYDFFVALSYSKMNKVRSDKYGEAKAKGYSLVSYISSRATIFDNVRYGDNCFILESNVVQPFVRIGNNCTLWSGNHIGHHSIIEDDCFIASHVVISGGVTVEQGCFIGVNATVRDGVTLGRQSLIGAGSLILGSTEPESVFTGNKAQARNIKSVNISKI
ncbi:MAG: acetyltransferase [Candidatus Obscuribacterales bacterium]|nr:acetyltransferase [Candidatus Obscuribacterales bacterium]